MDHEFCYDLISSRIQVMISVNRYHAPWMVRISKKYLRIN